MAKTGLVIGGGPAGLMAAEAMADAGLQVTVAEARPTVGRKLLMAGKSGLNLTKDEPREQFLAAFDRPDRVARALADFGPPGVAAWARVLGQPVFTGSSGRVFPVAMKASPLLRAWLARLSRKGVEIRTRWRWTGAPGEALFATSEGDVRLTPDVTVLALGGASWSRLGSDGAWAARFPPGTVAPFRPANMGLVVNWSERMAGHFGAPVKTVRLIAGDSQALGDFVISERGIEGSAVYAVSRAVREGAPLHVDLVPGRTRQEVAARLGRRQRRETLSTHLRKRLGLGPVKRALLAEFGHPLPRDPESLAGLVKALPIRHDGPRPLDEAISVAGGLRFEALDSQLMLRAFPGVFACGEMLDWEAPTGGYLLTACLATGLLAGRSAARWALVRGR